MLRPEGLDVAWVEVLCGRACPEAPGLLECLAQLCVVLLALALRGHRLEGSFCLSPMVRGPHSLLLAAPQVLGKCQDGHNRRVAALRALPGGEHCPEELPV